LDGGFVVEAKPPSSQDDQMRFVTPRVHKILDFVTVVAFALSPTLVPLTGLGAIVAYALAVIHLALTLGTQFPGAARRPMPFRAHGLLETFVGLALLVLPSAVGWTGRTRVFYFIAGMVVLAVSLVSRYHVEAPASDGAAV
jgi:hypothetical protein